MAFGFQGNAFQHNWGFQGGAAVIPGPVSGGFGTGEAGRKRKKKHKTLVEIEGVEYVVRSEYEARELLAKHQGEIIARAEAAAKTALNKARDVERKTGRLPVLEVAIPEIEAEPGGDPDIIAMMVEAQRGVDEAYLRAAQSMELAFLAQRAYREQDEEEAITLLLMS